MLHNELTVSCYCEFVLCSGRLNMLPRDVMSGCGRL